MKLVGRSLVLLVELSLMVLVELGLVVYLVGGPNVVRWGGCGEGQVVRWVAWF